jgi:hypothetical protein
MTEILVDIPGDFIAQLDSISQKKQLPRDILICTAIRTWLSQQAQTIPINAFGLLKDKLVEDSIQWQKKVRSEWRKDIFH